MVDVKLARPMSLTSMLAVTGATRPRRAVITFGGAAEPDNLKLLHPSPLLFSASSTDPNLISPDAACSFSAVILLAKVC